MTERARKPEESDGELLERASEVAAARPIERRSLHDELLDRLRALIVEGGLVPGSKVPERELCEQFGVSRTPMREALKVLAAEGLVVLTPNRGSTVAELTLAELEETFPVMGVLEGLAGELACRNGTDTDIAEVRRLHDDMLRHYAKRDLKAYFAVNQAIHDTILKAARNDTLAAMHGQLAGRVRRARYRANMSDKRWAQAVAEHEAILEALTKRDGSKLATLLRTHLDNKFETVREALASKT